MLNRGTRTALCSAQAQGVSGSWVNINNFVGPSGMCNVRSRGTWGGTTLTIRIAEDSSGTGAQTITSASYTADFAQNYTMPRDCFVQVVTTGGAGASLTVTASPLSSD